MMEQPWDTVAFAERAIASSVGERKGREQNHVAVVLFILRFASQTVQRNESVVY